MRKKYLVLSVSFLCISIVFAVHFLPARSTTDLAQDEDNNGENIAADAGELMLSHLGQQITSKVNNTHIDTQVRNYKLETKQNHKSFLLDVQNKLNNANLSPNNPEFVFQLPNALAINSPENILSNRQILFISEYNLSRIVACNVDISSTTNNETQTGNAGIKITNADSVLHLEK